MYLAAVWHDLKAAHTNMGVVSPLMTEVTSILQNMTEALRTPPPSERSVFVLQKLYMINLSIDHTCQAESELLAFDGR